MQGRFLFIISIFLLAGILWGCSSGSCEQPTESQVNMTFRLTDKEINSAVDSITVFGIGMENESIYDTVTTKVISLPLNPPSGSVQFVVRKGSVDDTVTISYTGEIRFISKECGYAFFYKITSTDHSTNWISNTVIINPDISPGDEENLRTFH